MGFLDSVKGMFGKSKNVADVNNDGKVSVADVASVPSAVAGAAADVNNDGKVNLADAQAGVQSAQSAVSGAADVNNDGQVNSGDVHAAAENVQQAAGGAVDATQTAVGDAADKLKQNLPQ